jgi:hypothetical protein
VVQLRPNPRGYPTRADADGPILQIFLDGAGTSLESRTARKPSDAPGSRHLIIKLKVFVFMGVS